MDFGFEITLFKGVQGTQSFIIRHFCLVLFFLHLFTTVSNGNSLDGGKILIVAQLLLGHVYRGAKEFNWDRHVNGPWRTPGSVLLEDLIFS
jgi:hypothetical protein